MKDERSDYILPGSDGRRNGGFRVLLPVPGQQAFLDAGGNAIPSDCYVGITVDAYFPIPKSYTKGKRLACQHNINRPAKKPDIDNTLKVVLDALNGVAYEDDKQVVEVICRKWYSQSTGFLKISVREVKA